MCVDNYNYAYMRHDAQATSTVNI